MSKFPPTPSEYRRWWEEMHPDIPFGCCLCGCGNPTTVASITSKRQGNFKGMPRRFIRGHYGRNLRDFALEDRGYVTPCHIWQQGLGKGGYGKTYVNGVRKMAHRHIYERDVRPLPDNVILHHLCAVKKCVNPAHLEEVTRTEHIAIHRPTDERWGSTPQTSKYRAVRGLRAMPGLADLRKSLCLSQVQFAKEAGLGSATVNKIERGERAQLRVRIALSEAIERRVGSSSNPNADTDPAPEAVRMTAARRAELGI